MTVAVVSAKPAPVDPLTLVGKPAPDFVLRSLDGQNRRLSEFRGNVVLINFWARWAGDTREEMPALDRLYSIYGRSGLVVLGVAVDEDTRRARDFAAAMKVAYPVLFDPTAATGKDYLLRSMPMTILVDRSGIVRFSDRGFKRGDDRTYLDQVRELLRE